MAAPRTKIPNLTKVITNLENGLGSISLPALKSIHLEVKQRNSSPGLRAFEKQVLPRLAYSNPALLVKVKHLKTLPNKKRMAQMPEEEKKKITQEVEKEGSESLKAEFHNMPSRAIPVTGKSVSQIAKELLDLSHDTQDSNSAKTSSSSSSSSSNSENEKRTILEKVAESQGASQAQL